MRVEPQVHVDSGRSAVDAPVRITVTGLAPRQPALITATTADGACVRWGAEIVVSADDDGTIDLSRDAPDSGSYRGVDALGLLWSMRPLTGPASQLFVRRRPTPLVIDIEVRVDGATVAWTRATRDFTGAGACNTSWRKAARPAPQGGDVVLA